MKPEQFKRLTIAALVIVLTLIFYTVLIKKKEEKSIQEKSPGQTEPIENDRPDEPDEPDHPSATGKPVEIKDEMILIPGGRYKSGSGEKHEAPAGEVELEEFYIDRYPVTVGQYLEFLEKTGVEWAKNPAHQKRFSRFLEKNMPRNVPVTTITFDEAAAYARWVGKRLPTEAEWEAAARGKEGYIFPWGNKWNEEKVDMRSRGLIEAGLHPDGASPFGVEDMVGNVFHWTLTGCNILEDQASNTRERIGSQKIIKAGGWSYFPRWNRCAFRSTLSGDCNSPFLGFRCVKPKNPANDVNLTRYGEIQGQIKPENYESTEAMRQVFSYELHPARKLHPVIEGFIKKIPPGSTVADVGCGIGFLTYRISRVVGPKGHVYSVDIDPGVLEFVRVIDEEEEFHNITPLQSAKDDIKVPEGVCDQVWLLGTIRYLEDEQRAAFLASCRRALKKGGLLIIIELNHQRFKNVDPVLEMLPRAGFEPVEEHKDLEFEEQTYLSPYSFIKIFRRKD